MHKRLLRCILQNFTPQLRANRSFLIWRRQNPFFDFDSDRKFRLMFDISDFNPRDVDVKVEGSKIKISAQRHTSHRHYKDSTQISREYDIPEDVDTSTIKTSSEAGILVIEGDRRVCGDTTQVDSEKEFIMNVDLNGFKPENISVKVEGDELRIEAKQVIQNVADNNIESKMHRHFSRCFTLPANIDRTNIKAKFGNDGRLSLTSPFVAAPKLQEKVIKIEKD